MINDPNITISVVQVTPHMAAAWLGSAGANRRISKVTVRRYASDMEAGRWHLTHQGIAFDAHGHLVDGQHRLCAVVASDMTIPMVVARGVASAAVVGGVDQNYYRTNGQTLAMLGVTNAASVAAVCRNMKVLVTPGLHHATRVSAAVIGDMLAAYRPSIDAFLSKSHKVTKVSRSPYIAVLALSYTSRFQERVVEFHHGVNTGESLVLGDPRLALRNWLLTSATSSGDGVGEIIVKTVSALDAFIHGDRHSKALGSAARYRRWCADMNIQENSLLTAHASRG